MTVGAALTTHGTGRHHQTARVRQAAQIARFSNASAFMIGHVLAQIDMLDTQLAAYAVRIEQAMLPFARAKQLLMTIPAVSDRIACGIIGSIGTDMTVLPTSGHLASWAGVCPGNNRSAGRDISSATTHGDPYLRGWLGIAAGIIAQTRSRPNYLTSYYHRLRTRRGALRAQVAVQHKILTAIWHMLTHDVAFHDLGADYFDHKPRSLQHQAHRAHRLLIELTEQGYDISQLIPENAA